MKQEDKADRLAVVAIKKQRYGIGKLSKEETKGMRKRTEERLMLAKVRGSLYYAVLFVSVIFAAATGIVGASVTILGIMAAKSKAFIFFRMF